MFRQARFKLTGWYLLIIMVISIAFSALIYQLASQEIIRFADSQRNRFERNISDSFPDAAPPGITVDNELINESKQRLLWNLLIINGFILVISGSLSYFLAGQTLLPIQEMTEDQKQFISDASHELRTPITALKTMIEVSLRDPNLSLVDSKKILKDAVSATDQLKNLSNSLLELNRLDKDHLNLTSVPVKKLIEDSVSKIKPQINRKKINLKLKPIKGNVKVDAQRIEELFVIVLDNAIKYSPKSSTIKFIAAKTKKNNVVFRIIDKGIGISEKDLPHVFSRFYRADNARTKNKTSGYGLGLPIAQKIVNAHCGKIKINSKMNYGTEFIISLPNFSFS